MAHELPQLPEPAGAGVHPVALPGGVTVAIADDDPGFVHLLAAVIDREPSMTVVGVAGDTQEAVALVDRERPDVLLVDVAMPGGGGAQAAREVRRRHAGTQILAVSGYEEREAVLGMLRAGAIGYLVKGGPISRLLEAIQRAARGEGDISSEVAHNVLQELGGRLAREEDRAQSHAARRRRIEQVLDATLVSMVFQPIVELETGALRGFEALARFPVEPLRGPAAWFAAATDVGLLVELELMAISAAFDRLASIPADLSLSVNASPSTAMSSGLASLAAQHAGRRLVLEITEHAPVDDYAGLAQVLAPLRAGGLRLAIDDAGAGFASLRHILRLAPDTIKVDQTLTQGIESDPSKRALARALISFARDIGAEIVAEGIETSSELEALRALGVRYGQGFHLGRPAPLDAALVGASR